MAKPVIDWTDVTEREVLIDSRARDAYALLEGRILDGQVAQAAALLATVAGQDVEQGEDGVFRIARKVAKDRVISTVDPQARHGHKTVSRAFDGYKGHIAGDPDSEIITGTAVSAGNCGDAETAVELLDDILAQPSGDGPGEDGMGGDRAGEPDDSRDADGPDDCERPVVYGDAAYGTGPLLAGLHEADVEANVKVQQANAPDGRFTKESFDIDLDALTVTCPNGARAPIRPSAGGGGIARFGRACAGCPPASGCTTAKDGRNIKISLYEEHLARGRARSTDAAWLAGYRATRPKVERKIAHLMRHRHGGRRARMRGRDKIAADFTIWSSSARGCC